MLSLGVRGLRVNMADGTDGEIITVVRKSAAVVKARDWVVQFWIPLAVFAKLHDIIPDLGVTFVTDHFAHAIVGSKSNKIMDTIDPYETKGFPEVIDLLQRRLLFVKLSAPCQSSKQAPLYEDMRVVAESLITAGPDMVVYGSDWPHTSSKEGSAAAGGRLVPREYRDVTLVKIVKGWAGEEAQIQRMFADNPRRLWQSYSH